MKSHRMMMPMAVWFLIHPTYAAVVTFFHSFESGFVVSTAARQDKQEPSAIPGALLKAADEGDADAQFRFGSMYGMRKDYAETFKWFHKAAEQGHVVAQFNVATTYANGLVVTRDYTEASKCYRKAAEHGMAGAQFNLGRMYYEGKGVTQDYIQAYMWFDLAATGLEGKSKEQAAGSRDSVARNMTPLQITEAQRLAREWKSKQSR